MFIPLSTSYAKNRRSPRQVFGDLQLAWCLFSFAEKTAVWYVIMYFGTLNKLQ